MKRVQFGAEIVEFPDDMPDADIERVLSKQHASLAPPFAAPTKTDDQRRAEIGGGRLQMWNPGSLVGLGPDRFDLGVDLNQKTTEALAGAGRRFADIGTLGNRPMKDATADRLLDSSGYAAVGGAGADLATLLGPGALLRYAGAAMKGGKALQTVGQSMVAPQSVRAAAATGGIYNAATTSGDLTERAISGALGLGLGAVGQAAPTALARVIKPRGNAEANALRAAGVELTPGQALGGRWNVAEQKLTSLPIVGDMIAKSRGRSIESFNVAAVNEALAPLGVTLPKGISAGRDLINKADDIFEEQYGKIIPQLSAGFDNALNAGVDAAERIAAQGGKAKQFRAIVDDNVLSRFDQNSVIAGDALKQAESELKREARGFMRSGDPDQRKLGEALLATRDALMASATKSSPKEAIADLAKADAAYARFLRIQTAAGRQSAKDGVFTPALLASAVRQMSSGARKSQYAKGNALMQDFARSGERVVGNSFHDSGTAGRVLLGGGLLGGAYYADPTAAGGLLGAAALYSRPGQAALRAAMSPRSGRLIDIGGQLDRLSPIGGLLAPRFPSLYASQQ